MPKYKVEFDDLVQSKQINILVGNERKKKEIYLLSCILKITVRI